MTLTNLYLLIFLIYIIKGNINYYIFYIDRYRKIDRFMVKERRILGEKKIMRDKNMIDNSVH